MNSSIPPPIPSTAQSMVKQLAESMTLDELKNAVASLTMELDRREGRQKFQLPDHARPLLN